MDGLSVAVNWVAHPVLERQNSPAFLSLSPWLTSVRKVEMVKNNIEITFPYLFSSCEPGNVWFAILHAIPKLLFLLRELKVEERRMKWTV